MNDNTSHAPDAVRYWLTVADGDRVQRLLDPFRSREHAACYADDVRRVSLRLWPESAFYAFGMIRESTRTGEHTIPIPRNRMAVETGACVLPSGWVRKRRGADDAVAAAEDPVPGTARVY